METFLDIWLGLMNVTRMLLLAFVVAVLNQPYSVDADRRPVAVLRVEPVVDMVCSEPVCLGGVSGAVVSQEAVFPEADPELFGEAIPDDEAVIRSATSQGHF